jgi:hypothetical protein
VARALTRGLEPGEVVLLHDGGSARAAGGGPVVLEALPAVLAAIDAAGLEAVAMAPPEPVGPATHRGM